MNDTVKSRLEGIIQTKKGIDQSLRDSDVARQTEAQEKAAQKAAAKEAWSVALGQIDEAINFVNSEMAGVEMKLSAEESDRTSSAALAQYCILLNGSGIEGACKAVLNVNAFGTVQPVFLIPHSGRSPTRFDLQDVGADHYKDIIIDFVEQCLAYRQSKLRPEAR